MSVSTLKSKAAIYLLDPALEGWMRRTFPTETTLRDRLNTNKGSWDGMTVGDGVRAKVVENVIFNYLSLLRALHAENFPTSNDVHSVVAAKAYEQYASYIASADVGGLICTKAKPRE